MNREEIRFVQFSGSFVRYRAVCGFIPHGEAATLQYATGAYLLRDSTELAIESNATGVVSVWKSGRYINMQLSPLTQGGTQYWGYRCDSISGRTVHLCLHHRQNGDPLSYTKTVYASILIDISEERKEDFDELLIEGKGFGSLWLHFAVRPSGNRRKVRFIQT